MSNKKSEKEIVVSEIHKSARKNFVRRSVQLRGLNDLVQIDLIEMIPYAKLNKGHKYILIGINCFTKKAYARAITNKNSKETTTAMESILKEMKIPPKNVQSDQGKEFFNTSFNNLMRKYDINHYHTFTHMKASIVERLIRTIKHKIYCNFSLQGKYIWLPYLQSIINEYNNTVHHTTNLKPNEVTKKHEKELISLYASKNEGLSGKNKFKLGDYVRISKYKGVFAKSYTPNWSTELFTIHKVQQTKPVTYILKDTFGTVISGAFYSQELQKTLKNDVYLIEKILAKKGQKVKVRFLGLGKEHDAWIDSKDFV